MRRSLWTAALVTGAALFCAAPVRADTGGPEPDCSTPKKAARTWLGNLQQDAWKPNRATRCFDWQGTGLRGAERETAAIRLKRVLDARGLYVEVDELPDSHDAGGEDRVRLFSDELPKLYFERRGGRWLLSSDSVERISELHDETFTVDVQSLVDHLPEWTRAEALGSAAWWQILGLALLIFAGILLRAFVGWLLASQGARLLRKQGDSADATVLTKAARPIGTLTMAAGIWWMLPMLRFSARVSQVGNIALRVLAATSAVMILYRLVDVLSDIFARRAEKTATKLDDQLVPLVRKSAKVFVIALGVIFVLQNMDVDVGSLLAGASLGGLAFTLAARDTVANFFGSVSIFADRPFQVGDWVVIGSFEGIVEEVGMRSTRLRTFYSSVVTMPNHIIASSTVDNYGARRYRRCYATVGLTYDTSPEQMQAFVEGVRAILAANPDVLKDSYEVHFAGFGSHSLEVMLYYFFEVPTWSRELEQRHNIYLEIMRLADELGVSFAFPTQTLHVESMAEPRPPRERPRPDEEALAAAVHAFGPEGGRARPQGPKLTHGYHAGAGARAGRAGGDEEG